MKGDDFVRQDVHQLAGGVQRDSGERVVEASILRNQALKQESAEYWIERASYYRGRGETDLEKESFRKALEIIPARPNTNQAAADRFEIVRSFFFLEGSDPRPSAR